MSRMKSQVSIAEYGDPFTNDFVIPDDGPNGLESPAHRFKLKAGIVLSVYGIYGLVTLPERRYSSLLFFLVGFSMLHEQIVRRLFYENKRSFKRRVPRLPFISYLLSNEIVLGALLLAPWILLCFRAMAEIPALSNRAQPGRFSALDFSLGVVIVLFCMRKLVPGTFRYWKLIVGRDFNVVLLRRFAKENAFQTRNVIAPVFGAYGRLLTFNDPTFKEAGRYGSPNLDAAIEVDRVPQYEAGDVNWREGVRRALCYADLAVFDIPETLSENMRWELEQAQALLPAERIILVLRPESQKAIGSIQLVLHPESQVKATGDIQTLIVPNSIVAQAILFPLAVYRMMRRLHPIPFD